MLNAINHPIPYSMNAIGRQWLEVLAPDKNTVPDEVSTQVRTAEYHIYLDDSGSIGDSIDPIFNTVHDLIAALAEKNRTSLTEKYRVKIVLFGESVRPINEVSLPPAQISEIFTRDMYQAHGTTNIGEVVAYDDALYSRTSPLVTNRKKGDFKVTRIYFTDLHGTDSEATRMEAIKRMRSNRLADQISQCLCVYIGSEEDKHEAVMLTGSEENIVALNSNLDKCLTPVVIKGTIALSDATHIGYNSQPKTATQISKQERERTIIGGITSTDISGKSPMIPTGKSLDETLAALLGTA